jgi:ABC-type uncharacterized transport system substrate-binding protein
VISLSKAAQQAGLTLGVAALLASNLSYADGYHYKVQVATQLQGNPAGDLTALKMDWTYDTELAGILLEDEDLSEANKATTLKNRANDILEDLAKLDYFTKVTVGGQAIALNKVQVYDMSLKDDGSMILSYVLPLKAPAKVAANTVTISLADPDGVGELIYKNAEQISLDTNLSKACAAPTVSGKTVDLPTDHKAVVPTASIVCK